MSFLSIYSLKRTESSQATIHTALEGVLPTVSDIRRLTGVRSLLNAFSCSSNRSRRTLAAKIRPSGRWRSEIDDQAASFGFPGQHKRNGRPIEAPIIHAAKFSVQRGSGDLLILPLVLAKLVARHVRLTRDVDGRIEFWAATCIQPVDLVGLLAADEKLLSGLNDSRRSLGH